MKFGIITGEKFFKTSSQYIARLLSEKLACNHHEVFVFNKTNFPLDFTFTKTIKVEGALTKLFSANLFEQRTIKNLLKQNNIEQLFVFETGDIIKTEIPQVLVMNNEPSTDAETLQKLTTANKIIMFSESLQQKLVILKPELKERIFVSPSPTQSEVQTFSYNAKLAAKEQFAEEKEYFVYTDFDIDREKFLNLLKAFSSFKKMQQTNWKLVVYFRSRFTKQELEEILQPLSNFKYRNDVNIVNNQDDSTFAECLSGAYAHISTTENTVSHISVLEALLSGVPSVALHSDVTEKYADAVLELLNSEPETIAEKMMILYKNESLRSRISQKAEELTAGFDRDANLNKLVSMILR